MDLNCASQKGGGPAPKESLKKDFLFPILVSLTTGLILAWIGPRLGPSGGVGTPKPAAPRAVARDGTQEQADMDLVNRSLDRINRLGPSRPRSGGDGP